MSISRLKNTLRKLASNHKCDFINNPICPYCNGTLFFLCKGDINSKQPTLFCKCRKSKIEFLFDRNTNHVWLRFGDGRSKYAVVTYLNKFRCSFSIVEKRSLIYQSLNNVPNIRFDTISDFQFEIETIITMN